MRSCGMEKHLQDFVSAGAAAGFRSRAEPSRVDTGMICRVLRSAGTIGGTLTHNASVTPFDSVSV